MQNDTHTSSACRRLLVYSGCVVFLRHFLHSGQLSCVMMQWLKCKFGGPGTLTKFGALLQAEGTPLNLLVQLTAVWGLGTLASNFLGPRNGVPPYFNHCYGVLLWVFAVFLKENLE